MFSQSSNFLPSCRGLGLGVHLAITACFGEREVCFILIPYDAKRVRMAQSCWDNQRLEGSKNSFNGWVHPSVCECCCH